MTRLLQVYFVLLTLPLVVVMSHQLLAEKASGLKERILLADGASSQVSPLVYWASWWAFFILLSVATSVTLGVAFWAVAFYDASVWLIVTYFFLVSLSCYSLVWAVQALCFSRHQSALIFTFVFFMLIAPYSLIDQTHLPVPSESKQIASFSAMVAANETLKLLTEFSSFKYGLSFYNYGEVIANYSVKKGFFMLAIDSLIYFAIGCVLETFSVVFGKVRARRSQKTRTTEQE